ncbi:MAG: ABC transporter permease [Longimicrobiales bacterium]|nr:ABC transporter permease [Longimicrobiales bacterium]
MSILFQDLKFGIRMLGKTPVVSSVAALSLALGIAAATAMFALASAFWLEPLPFGDQEGLVMVRELRHGESIDMAANASAPNFRDWRDAASNLSSMTAMDIRTANVTGVDMPEEIQIAVGTTNLFEVLQLQPAQGRAFRPEEGTPGTGEVVVITDRYWKQHFREDPGVLGQTLTLDGTPYTVIGVMPEDFEMLPAMVEVFRATDLVDEEERGSKGWMVVGRLQSEATVEQARSEITGIAARLETEYPEANRGWGVLVQPARQWFPGPTDAKLVMLLIAVSLFGVAIACANVANLLLSRAETRMKEIAVRTAIGAGRVRIVRQLLTESVLLGLVGGGVGTLIAVYVIRALNAAMPAELPQAFRPSLDVPTLLITVGIAVAAGILFGLAPALHAIRGNLKEALGDGSRGGTASRSRKRLRNVFVVGQIGVALALLTGAGELREVMNGLVFADNGFRAEGLLTFQLTLPEYKYAEASERLVFQEEMIRTLGSTPGVEGVAVMASLPRGRQNLNNFFQIEGREVEELNERPRTNWQSVNPDYFNTLEIPHLSGRLLEDGDREGATLVAVVNQEFARRFFPNEELLGKRIELQGEYREIVGVVGNIMQSRIPFDGFVEPGVYLPMAQVPRRNPAVAVRASGNPTALVSDVRAVIRSIDPDQPITLVRTMEEHITYEVAAMSFLAAFAGALGILAMFLSAIGIYGVMAHGVLQERREMGIRLALGARSGQLVGMVTRRGLLLSALGMAIGIPLALGIHRAVMSALDLFDANLGYGMALTAGGLLMTVAILASYLPARSAARVQPTQALSLE